MTQITFTLSSILGSCAALSSVFGAYLKVRRIFKDRKEAKLVEKAIIVQEAKEHSHRNKIALEAKLEVLEADMNAKLEALAQSISTIEHSVNKDLEHIRETYSSEIRFLGTRIEELKDQLSIQISQVVILVSKLIDKD